MHKKVSADFQRVAMRQRVFLLIEQFSLALAVMSRLQSVVVYSPSSSYWSGLYKTEDKDDAPTYWLDGNPSAYRWWLSGEPNNDVWCIRYTTGGFTDRPCSNWFRYTCKKIASK